MDTICNKNNNGKIRVTIIPIVNSPCHSSHFQLIDSFTYWTQNKLVLINVFPQTLPCSIDC